MRSSTTAGSPAPRSCAHLGAHQTGAPRSGWFPLDLYDLVNDWTQSENVAAKYPAEVEVPQGGGEGIIEPHGGRFGGYGFYMLQGKPVFLWDLVDLKRLRWEGPELLSPGKHTLEFDFKYDGLGMDTVTFNSMSGLGLIVFRPRPPPAENAFTLSGVATASTAVRGRRVRTLGDARGRDKTGTGQAGGGVSWTIATPAGDRTAYAPSSFRLPAAPEAWP